VETANLALLLVLHVPSIVRGVSLDNILRTPGPRSA